MRIIIKILLSMLMGISMASAQEGSLNDVLDEMNSLSKSKLGVSLKAVQFLLNDSTCIRYIGDYLEKKGELELIEELEEAGIVEVIKTKERLLDGNDDIGVDTVIYKLKLLHKNKYDDC